MSDNAELAAVRAKLEAIEKQLPRKTKGVEPDGVPLSVCNAAAERAQQEVLEEKRDAASLAKKAIDEAFAGRTKKAHRVQKNLSPVAAERLAAASK
jgi:capsule polysaccharide export protein KpsE/RkpR